jgi:SAGA-associated factor 29
MSLPDLPRGRNVLALYPGTTTFYTAEVVRGWVGTGGKDGLGGKSGIKKEEGGKEGEEGMVRLRFEGEDEADREMSVERRYVLPDK